MAQSFSFPAGSLGRMVSRQPERPGPLGSFLGGRTIPSRLESLAAQMENF